MTAPVQGVAAALRERLPGLPAKKLHKLLYYCQGHHLATFDEPLFDETISAWDMGPVVGMLWYQEKHGAPPASCHQLTEAHLNTVGYVVSRYGALTGRDLEVLTHSEGPWQRADRARQPGTSSRIAPEWIRDYFKANGSKDDEDEVLLDSTVVTEWLSGAEARRADDLQPDNIVDLQARLGTTGD
jgi:uncharacterized phage-associated protein